MSPGNLGIVFGPTLLRPLVSGDISMIALLETSYQALLVEFMISHYDHIFGPATRSRTPPPPPPTAPLPDTPPRASCPLSPANSSSQEPEAAGRERPRSLEVGNKYLTSHNRRSCFKLSVVMTMLKAHLRWTCPCRHRVHLDLLEPLLHRLGLNCPAVPVERPGGIKRSFCEDYVCLPVCLCLCLC